MVEQHVYDMIVIGAGPAGLGTAIYAVRAGMDVLVIEKNPVAGGQIINAAEVDNYLGLPGIGGFELGDTFRAHADNLGVAFSNGEVMNIEPEGETKKIFVRRGKNENVYECKTMVIAMGAEHAVLGIPGEKEFTGRGVSYCATCDGSFFRGKDVCVVGGGDVAVADAIYLSGMCNHVTLIHRRDTLRAANSLQKALLSKDNITVSWNSALTAIWGDGIVNKVTITNLIDQTEMKKDISGVFVAVGMKPESAVIPECINTDEKGYIIAGEDCKTNIPGVFVTGDIRTKQVRQVITAVADGANAVSSAEEYLR